MEFELEPGEEIIHTARTHWLVLVGYAIPYIILAYLPTLFPQFSIWLAHLNPSAKMVDLSTNNPYIRLGLGLWWLVLWIGAFNTFTRYYLNMWVITNQRIVEIKQFGFFDRQVSSFLLARVQDITTTVDGFFADVFGFGTVRIETAGDESQHFAMGGLRDPQGMRDLIMREIALLHQGGASSGTE